MMRRPRDLDGQKLLDWMLSNTKIKMNNCMEWNKSKFCKKSGFNYGQIKYKGKATKAHRLVYILLHGSIQVDQFICHFCDNPPCINPNHLWLGSPQKNSSDMINKNRSNFGEKHGNVKLTFNKVKQIRDKYNLGISKRELAKQFAISESHTDNIVNYRSWKNLTVAGIA